MDRKEKATITDIQNDMKPFLKHSFLHTYIESRDVTPACRLIRNKYRNVTIEPRPGKDGYPYLMIHIKALLSSDIKYEIRNSGKRTKTHDPLRWIDDIERWDAMM